VVFLSHNYNTKAYEKHPLLNLSFQKMNSYCTESVCNILLLCKMISSYELRIMTVFDSIVNVFMCNVFKHNQSFINGDRQSGANKLSTVDDRRLFHVH
jgi:hypothetical protein